MNDHEVVAAVTYYPERQEFLLVKRSDDRPHHPGLWGFPSGETGDESIQDAALRELSEETGLMGQVIRTGEAFDIDSGKDYRVTPVLIVVENQDIELSREHSGHEWVNIDEIEKYDTVPGLIKDLESVGVK